MKYERFLVSALLLSLATAHAPLIERAPQSQTVASGNIAFFVCTAGGNPNPQIEWLKDSRRAKTVPSKTIDIPNGSILRIEPVREFRDDSTIECVASNGVGEPAVASAVLKVLPGNSLPPGFPVFTVQPAARAIGKGNTALLPCQVEGDPQPTVTWLKNMIPLNTTIPRYSIVEEGSLQIRETGKEDEGKYECMAENSFGSVISNMAALYVTVRRVPPQFTVHLDKLYEVMPGDTVNIRCVAVGEPMPLVKWRKGSVDITPERIGRSDLLLENIMESANYTCAAESVLGSIQETIEIVSIELPPQPQCECDWRYLKHYETKKCSPVFEEGCDCPVRFDCSDEHRTSENVCEYKGNMFQFGEKIETSNPCDRCSCRRSFPGGTEMRCVTVKCPPLLRLPQEKNCYEVYEADKCCSVDVKCPDPESENQGNITADPESENQGNITEPTCEYGGKNYHPGERIFPVDDSCLSCLCDENWEGVNTNSCQIYECLLETKLRYLNRGCVPIYHEKKCCPIEFYCGTGSDGYLSNYSTGISNGSCFFRGMAYSIGEVLDIKHPTNCVTCTCRTPPDFTCVHGSCPPPPNNDYQNCRSVYHEGECCPVYECLQYPTPVVCEPVKCLNECREVVGRDGCPLCLCNELLCAPPNCPDGCVVQYDVPEGSCPQCKCPSSLQFAPVQCSPVKCDPQCFEVVGSDGCLECLCGPLCFPPECDAGCSVQKEVPKGQCPGCVCESSPNCISFDGILDGQQILCAPVKCGPTCRKTVGQFGCPTCLCDPLCSPPLCAPGCKIETVPSSGPCPGCVCGDQPADP